VSKTEKKNRSAAELKAWYDKNGKAIERFESSHQLVSLINKNKLDMRNYRTFSKELLRNFMQNPNSNQRNLRELSRFLFYRSNPYRRLIYYNASMIDLNARTVIPLTDITKEEDKVVPDYKREILKDYYLTLKELEKMNLNLEVFKMLIIAWREDAAFGCVYHDDSGFFILPLDGNYCKITGAYLDGTLSFSYDMSWFRSRLEQLEMYGEPFVSMYERYIDNPIENQWQEVPPERAWCFKVNIDDILLPLPPYLPLFNSIVSLADLEEIQAIKDEMSIYKMIIATIPLLSSTETPDDFAVNPATALEYYQKMVDELPDYVGAALTPIPLDTISFQEDAANDVNTIENATEALFNTSGGAQILNSSSISGATAFKYAVISDGLYATSSLLPQTEQLLNRFLSYRLANPSKVKFLKVTPYTKEDYKKSIREDATYGLPNRLVINALNGFSELETLSMKFLEQDILSLHEELIPVQSTHTQASGGNAKDDSELSDEGEATRDEDKNFM